MEPNEIKAFVESFFTLRDCTILENDPSYLTVELNPETDKDLGYRPFYWSYIENMRMKPQLLVKRYIFDPAFEQREMSDEYLLFGSYRLRQIFLAAKKKGQFIRLYEEDNTIKGTTALSPWIMVNYKVEYVCDKKREQLFSFGYNLITGLICDNFYKQIENMRLTPKLPAYFFTQSPLHSTQMGFAQIEQRMNQLILSQDDSWALAAWQRYEAEKEQTIQYYQENYIKYQQKGNKNEYKQAIEQWATEKSQRIEELEWQYMPRIEVSPINMGVLYLLSTPKYELKTTP